MGVRLVSISYQNVTGGSVAPHSVLQLTGDPYVTPTGDLGFQATLPGYGTGPYVIDNGKGTSGSGAGQYGSCFRAFEGAVWVAYAAGTKPLPAVWGQVGPTRGLLTMSGDGLGYYYAGAYDATNSRMLVTQSLSSIALHQGVTTSAITTAVTNSWTGAATIRATEMVSNPSDHSTPGQFTIGSTNVPIVVREKMTIPSGAYIQWLVITLGDGRTENEMTWVKAGGGTLHQGVATTGIGTASTDSWIRPFTFIATEYIPNPAGTGTPWGFMPGGTGLTIVARDHLTIGVGAFVQWIECTMSDGSTERELTWVKPTSSTLHQGIVFTGATSFDNWIRPATIEVTEYTPDLTVETPQDFVIGSIVDVVVRDKITVRKGAYVQWQTITLADGSTENELTYVGSNTSFHQGLVAIGATTFESWIRPSLISVTEYVDDPTTTGTPRKFVPQSLPITVVVRDTISVSAGQYVQWQTVTLSDGSTENELTYVRPTTAGFNIGIVAVGLPSFGADPMLGPGVITVVQYIDEPGAFNSPRNFRPVSGGFAVSVVVRDNLVIRVGAIVQWKTITLSDGSIENELTWVKPTTIHQGITTVGYTKSRVWDRWTNAGMTTADEYVDDPSSIDSPRDFIPGPTANTIVVRSNVPTIPSGTYIHWQEFPLSDGTYENILTWADC